MRACPPSSGAPRQVVWGEAEPIMEVCFGICLQDEGESDL